MTTLFTNIACLVNVREASPLLRGKELSQLPCLKNAFLILEDENISGFGSMHEFKYNIQDFTEHHELKGRFVLPSWCDSHSHLVYAGSREGEFVDKIMGLSYAEIAARGGGILQSAQSVNDATEEELYQQSLGRLRDVMKMGTGALEIKSGYGLSLEGELKMLRVIRRLQQSTGMLIRSTFLGAHALPTKYRDNREDYISLVIDKMLPQIAAEKLADYIDVFCENNFFTPEETKKICAAGKAFGLKPKIHANQLATSGGVEAGVDCGAISVDHLESMDEHAIHALAHSNTIGTLLPSAAFFLRMPYQPARKLIDANCAIALASDYNPGSSPSGNMNFVVALACIQMQMLPDEAINAATINGAHAMELQQQAGSITIGKKANLMITVPIPSLAFIPYSFGSNLLERVMLKGEWVS